MIKKNVFLSFMFLALSALVHAEEAPAMQEELPQQKEEGCDAQEGLRRHAVADHITLEELIAQAEEIQEQQELPKQSSRQSRAISSLLQRGYQDYQSMPSIVHAGVLHWWVSCALDWSVFQLEDGSQWFIALEDRFRIVDWASSHFLVLRRNDYYNSNPAFRYQLYNTVLDEAIQVTNIAGPYYGGPFTQEITYVSTFFGDVHLNYNSTWTVYSADEYMTTYWLPGQAVVIGINNESSFFRYPYDYILINIEIGNSVRAAWDQR